MCTLLPTSWKNLKIFKHIIKPKSVLLNSEPNNTITQVCTQYNNKKLLSKINLVGIYIMSLKKFEKITNDYKVLGTEIFTFICWHNQVTPLKHLIRSGIMIALSTYLAISTVYHDQNYRLSVIKKIYKKNLQQILYFLKKFLHKLGHLRKTIVSPPIYN